MYRPVRLGQPSASQLFPWDPSHSSDTSHYLKGTAQLNRVAAFFSHKTSRAKPQLITGEKSKRKQKQKGNCQGLSSQLNTSHTKFLRE